VVVTAAMRNPSLTSPDGPGNLLAAVRVAADPWVRGTPGRSASLR
jgi:L-asparaginase